jgi:hypothetical protein
MRRWGDDPGEQEIDNGHPDRVHIAGKVYTTRQVIGSSRWPAFVRGLAFWRPSPGSAFGCAVLNEDGGVISIQPVPLENQDGEGI